jgi:hypothetical protein
MVREEGYAPTFLPLPVVHGARNACSNKGEEDCITPVFCNHALPNHSKWLEKGIAMEQPVNPRRPADDEEGDQYEDEEYDDTADKEEQRRRDEEEEEEEEARRRKKQEEDQEDDDGIHPPYREGI